MKENRTRGTSRFPFELYAMYTEEKNIFVACHWQEEVEILRVVQGKVELLINGILNTLYKGDIAFINPGQLHQLQGLTSDTMYYAYVFPMTALSFEQEDIVQIQIICPLLDKTLVFPSLITKTDILYESVLFKIDQIININRTKPYAFEMLTKIYLLELIYLFKQQNRFLPRYCAKQADTCKNILTYIQEHYSERITISELAAYSGLSGNYFSAFFKNHFGMTFTHYLTGYRIEQACTLLETTDLSVTEIALQTGFDTTSYFIQKFKKAMGMTPNRYRNRHM